MGADEMLAAVDVDVEHLLAEHRAATDELKRYRHERDILATVIRNRSTSIICSQCGRHFHESACGPSHAIVAQLVAE